MFNVTQRAHHFFKRDEYDTDRDEFMSPGRNEFEY